MIIGEPKTTAQRVMRRTMPYLLLINVLYFAYLIFRPFKTIDIRYQPMPVERDTVYQ